MTGPAIPTRHATMAEIFSLPLRALGTVLPQVFDRRADRIATIRTGDDADERGLAIARAVNSHDGLCTALSNLLAVMPPERSDDPTVHEAREALHRACNHLGMP